jgi:hypothetical protein
MDENQDQAVNEPVEETTTDAASPAVEEQTDQPQPEAELARLRQFLPTQEPSPRDSSNFADRFAGQDQVLPEDLNRAAEEYAAQRATDIVRNEIDVLKSELGKEQLRTQVKEVQSVYSELNPDSDNYDPVLDEKIAVMYAKYGAGVPLSEYVEEQMALAGVKASRAAADTSAAVAKQKEESAILPGSKSKTEKPIEEKSIRELEAELGFAD